MFSEILAYVGYNRTHVRCLVIFLSKIAFPSGRSSLAFSGLKNYIESQTKCIKKKRTWLNGQWQTPKYMGKTRHLKRRKNKNITQEDISIYTQYKNDLSTWMHGDHREKHVIIMLYSEGIVPITYLIEQFIFEEFM